MGFFNKKKENNNDGLVAFSEVPNNFDNYANVPLDLTTYQIMQNDGVNICAEACACCWDTKIPPRYEERGTYIAKRTKIGHGSVTEHSNHVFYMEVSDDDLEDLAEFLSKCQYVHTIYKHSKKYTKGYLIIGGSWRAFNDIVKKNHETDMDNTVFTSLMNAIYTFVNSCGMQDLIEQKIIADHFENSDMSGSTIETYSAVWHKEISNNIEIINVDDFDVLLKNIKDFCPEPELFTIYDLLDMCTITVLFKNMSRIITQQLTRHRNGITQESQRYVNYSKGKFNSPHLFKEKYDPNFKYSIQFGRTSLKMTLQEIGDAIASLYGQLIDEVRTQKHNLQFEDARGFLPNNIQCGKLYMTFTWRTFFKFLELREDLHAQVEIRRYAKELGTWFRDLYPAYADFYDALIPASINESHYCYALTHDKPIDSSDEISFEEIVEKMEEQIANQEKAENNG